MTRKSEFRLSSAAHASSDSDLAVGPGSRVADSWDTHIFPVAAESACEREFIDPSGLRFQPYRHRLDIV